MQQPEYKHRNVGGFNPQHLSESKGFDGKKVRRAIQRRTVDYNTTILRYLEMRLVGKERRHHLAIQPESHFVVNYFPAFTYTNPTSSVTTKFIHASTNKVRCPINAISWTPEGRRLITGASSGEFTLWNGLTFNFETILQAHDTAIRCMKWSHNDTWMISGEDSGTIKYWQSNMNNLKAVKAHKESVRDLTFSPTDSKFASCSDDGTIKIWSFANAQEERVLTGHGWDVKCIAWHPTKGLLASGSKDNLAKIWDPKSGKPLATLHGHKNTIMQIEWNKNGNWLLTACRDQLVRLYDIRTMKEMQVFRGHQREVQSIAWHPVHEKLFVSGGWEGSIHFWQTNDTVPVASMEAAHESSVFALDWHPLGHILGSASNDHTTKFWTRNRPGDPMNDRYNLSKEEASAIGLVSEDAPDVFQSMKTSTVQDGLPGLPGLGTDAAKARQGTGYSSFRDNNNNNNNRRGGYQQRDDRQQGNRQQNSGGNHYRDKNREGNSGRGEYRNNRDGRDNNRDRSYNNDRRY